MLARRIVCGCAAADWSTQILNRVQKRGRGLAREPREPGGGAPVGLVNNALLTTAVHQRPFSFWRSSVTTR